MEAISPETLDEGRVDLITRLAVQAERRGSGGLSPDAVQALLRRYFRHAPLEELTARADDDLYGAVVQHLKLALTRPSGQAQVRVSTPQVETDGWAAEGHSVIEIVTDDMPFLVDSVTMALDQAGHGVHLVLHPQLLVHRDPQGVLLDVSDGDDLEPRAADQVEEHWTRESWMHLEIDRVPADEVREITRQLTRVLADVRAAVTDWRPMHERVNAIVAGLGQHPPAVPGEEIAQGAAFLRWLAEDHFTFLGYREYRLVADGEREELRAVPGSGLGILRGESAPKVLPAAVAAKAREKTLLVIAKANARSTVHRAARMDYLGIKIFNDEGEVVGEQRFLGLFSSSAYNESVLRIPLAREKVRGVIAAAGFDAQSHAGKALLDVLETYPREELLQTPVAELTGIATAVMYSRERRQLRLFVRADAYGRYWSVLVYLPRDRYTTAVRERIAAILRTGLGGESVEYSAHVGNASAARVHFLIRPAAGQVDGPASEVDVAELERRCAEAARSWTDDFTAAVVAASGEVEGTRLARRYARSFPEAYKEDYPARSGAVDIARLEALPEGGTSLTLYEELGAPAGEARLKVYRVGQRLSLSDVLPVLTAMGVEVLDERPYTLEGVERPSHIYDFGLRYRAGLPEGARELFSETVLAVWEGRNESDGFNALVLGVGLTWRQAAVLRAYARHMQQGGTPFGQASIEDALRINVDITRLLVSLFEARFDPEAGPDAARHARCDALASRVLRSLDDVTSLDHDRILRSYLTWITATVRTNFFQQDAEGHPHPYLALKLEPAAIAELPEPRPRFEIFVHSPRVEGVHLRFGQVARGGLRWSDRRDDFRAEVLGLVKAQMVKNTVIVPVGAKGGFYAKQLPDPADRDAWMAEGVACYRTFIAGLLDITDNLVGGEVQAPRDVVRHDGDDPYLVVAADKGTATFSDIANDVATSYGFWLGDAFASGGSVGYDHKAMGITARGAWVSVVRHFRELGVDPQHEDITCVGIGDMSGDVFGNGMLCSRHIRLVAAFDHRDIFLDPDPDPEVSFVERQRLFDLPRSSWRDYDPQLISSGGGVYSRTAKSIRLSPEIRRVLGISEESLTPSALMQAILLAPVDLLWNGGIGTYVKASSETHLDAADKANDAIRVDGRQLRARCVGEGGNLGFTQRGRIEYARFGRDGLGGRINTDFIDNSAGVDTSDHEVNIKILLDRVVLDGDLTIKQRNALLASMTDEVAELVLADNDAQNLALANAQAQAAGLLHVHEDWMRALEARGVLNRDLEALPSRAEVATRAEHGQGLSGPELAVVLSYTKIVLEDDLLASPLAEDPLFADDLVDYFPTPMRETYRTAMEQHPLRREIVVTQVVNRLVNGAGTTFFHRLSNETSAGADQLAVAWYLARSLVGAADLDARIAGYDHRLHAEAQTRMRLEVRTLVERITRWLVTNRRLPLDSAAIIEEFGAGVRAVLEALPELMTGAEASAYSTRRAALAALGVDDELAAAVAACPPAYMAMGIVQTAARAGVDPVVAAQVHFAVGERLGFPGLVSRILALPRKDRWQTMARAALRDDLHSVHAQVTGQVLQSTDAEATGAARVKEWEQTDPVRLARAVTTFAEIVGDDSPDLARMSVALRVARSLLTDI